MSFSEYFLSETGIGKVWTDSCFSNVVHLRQVVGKFVREVFYDLSKHGFEDQKNGVSYIVCIIFLNLFNLWASENQRLELYTVQSEL